MPALLLLKSVVTNKKFIYAAIVAVILAVVAGFWIHYSNMVDELAAAKVEAAQLSEALAQEKKAFASAKENIEKWKEASVKFQSTLEAERKAAIASKEELRRLKHVFAKGEFAKMAPADAGRFANDSTARLHSMLKSATAGRRGADSATGADEAQPAPAPTD